MSDFSEKQVFITGSGCDIIICVLIKCILLLLSQGCVHRDLITRSRKTAMFNEKLTVITKLVGMQVDPDIHLLFEVSWLASHSTKLLSGTFCKQT